MITCPTTLPPYRVREIQQAIDTFWAPLDEAAAKGIEAKGIEDEPSEVDLARIETKGAFSGQEGLKLCPSE